MAGLAACEPLARHRDTVVVFARAPRLGAVKRRLAAEIGDRAALRFHTATLTRLLRMLCADRRFRTVLALTPDRATLRMPPRVARMAQGSGDLGRRMARAFRRFPHCRVALIGCDIPDANAADVAAAFRSLGGADAVFGPAADGGYWLVGMTPRRPARPFAAVRWSTQHALADTLANFAEAAGSRCCVSCTTWTRRRIGAHGATRHSHDRDGAGRSHLARRLSNAGRVIAAARRKFLTKLKEFFRQASQSFRAIPGSCHAPRQQRILLCESPS